jgi:hypothetical protein
MPAKTQAPADITEPAASAVTKPSPFQMLLRKMEQMASLDTDSARASRGEDVNAILLAETEEEMWVADEIPGFNAKMMSGCDLHIIGFDVKYGSANVENPIFVTSDGKQMYLLIQSARLNKSGEKKELRLPEVGEEFTWNTSARYIVAKMMWLLEHGYFDNGHEPVYARIQGTDLQGGKSVEKLKPLEGATFQSTTEVPF